MSSFGAALGLDVPVEVVNSKEVQALAAQVSEPERRQRDVACVGPHGAGGLVCVCVCVGGAGRGVEARGGGGSGV